MAPAATMLRPLRPRPRPRQTIPSEGPQSPSSSKANARVAADDDATANTDGKRQPNLNLPYHKFLAEVTDTNPKPGRKTSKFVTEKLAAITKRDRDLVADKTVANLPLLKRTTRAVARSRPGNAASTKNLEKTRRYEETLDAAWGGRDWLPPPHFSRIRPGKVGQAETQLSVNSLSYMATLARLCLSAGINVRTWYDEGGILREAAVLCHGPQPIRWSKDVPKRAVQLLRERHQTLSSTLQHQDHNSTADDEVARHAAEPEHDSDDESLGSISMELATTPLRQAYSSLFDGPDEVSVAKHHQYIRTSPVSSVQDGDHYDFTGFDIDHDEASSPNIGNEEDNNESVLEAADAIHENGTEPSPERDNLVQDNDIESAPEINHGINDSPVRHSSEEANSPTLENLPIAFKTLPKAVDQLRNGDQLTDDSIQVLQLVLQNSMVPAPRILVVDPLYFGPVGRLSTRLPRPLQNRRKDRIVSVVHNGRMKHWILVDISLTDRHVRSYDSIASSGASLEVKEAVAPWLSLHVPGPEFSFSTPRCPQQDDGTSCGVFALLGMKHLLAGNLTLADLDIGSRKHAREVLLRIALGKSSNHSTVPLWLAQVSTGLPPPHTQSPTVVPPPPQRDHNTFANPNDCLNSMPNGDADRGSDAKSGAATTPSLMISLRRRRSQQGHSGDDEGTRLRKHPRLEAHEEQPDSKDPVRTPPALHRRARLDALMEEIAALEEPSPSEQESEMEIQRFRSDLEAAKARSAEAAEALSALNNALINARTSQAGAQSSCQQVSKWAESVLQASSQTTGQGDEHSDANSDKFRKTKEAHRLLVEGALRCAEVEVDSAGSKVQEAEDAVVKQRQVVLAEEQSVKDAETLLGNAELSLKNFQDYKKLQGVLAA